MGEETGRYAIVVAYVPRVRLVPDVVASRRELSPISEVITTSAVSGGGKPVFTGAKRPLNCDVS